jgi:hypothetical protein
MKEYNVYFDASYLISNNLRSDVLETTFDSDVKMNFFITDICLEELYKNILKPIVPKLEIDLFLNTMTRISNTLQLPNYRAEIEERSKRRIDAFIKSNQIQIIETATFLDVEDYKKIIELAQNGKSPFKTKPREFKDAKSLRAILKHSKTTNIKPTLLSEDPDWKGFEIENRQRFTPNELLASEVSKARLLMAEQRVSIDLLELFLFEEKEIFCYIEKELENTCNEYFLEEHASAIMDLAVDRIVDFRFPSVKLSVGEPIYNFSLDGTILKGEIKIIFDFKLLVSITFNDLNTVTWDEGECVMAYPEIGEAQFEGEGGWKIPLQSISLDSIPSRNLSLLELMKSTTADITSFSLFAWETQTDYSYFE